MHPKIKFTIENERQNKTDYLDITIKKLNDKLEFGIYRKLTLLIQTLHATHRNIKKSAIDYLRNRMNTYPLSQENRARECNIIHTILKDNGYQPIQK
jgi:hypothetical protein